MLTQLSIRHFATVDYIELDPQAGLTGITGETGAGKSVLIDALALALGRRGNSDLVRTDCKRAEFTANFSIANNPEAQQWLAANELDDDDNNCQLRRTISADGRSRAWINGTPCRLQEVRHLADHLISIHSQHEHQLLLQKNHQRHLLDNYADALPQVKRVADTWKAWQAAHQAHADALNDATERSEREALLRFQLQELDELALQENELSQLESEQKRLANASQLIELCQQSLTLLYESDDGTANDLLSRAGSMLQEAAGQDDGLDPIADGIESARLQLEAASDDLRHYLDRLDLDPERLSLVESRLDAIYTLARKHRVRADALFAHHQSLQESAGNLQNIDAQLAQLEADEKAAETAYQKAAKALSSIRKKQAIGLEKATTKRLRELGMKAANLSFTLHPIDAGPHGLEQVELQFSAGPGQAMRPLAKVASGGELSRVSLAIQVVCAERLTLPCMVFDEVDVGIGGGIAEVVGRLLRQLGRTAQVFCITHQPQVASQAHHHWHVHKKQSKDSTTTHIGALAEKERTEEIARMLGGLELTDSTRQHAAEMLAHGQLKSA